MADGIVGKISVGDGATFTPSVSDGGVLSWENNKNLPNPESVDLSQAVIDRGGLAPIDSPAFTGTPTAPTPANTDNSTKLATTEFVNSRLGNYLSLTGGTMTGTIVLSTPESVKRNIDNGSLVLNGGNTGGAYLTLSGKDRAPSNGVFAINANNGTNNVSFQGKPDGTLTWGGQNILTASNYNSYALPLSGGTMTGIIQRDVSNTGYHELGRMRYNGIVAGTAPSGANVGGYVIQLVDSNYTSMGGIYKTFQTDGVTTLRFYDNFGSGNSVGVALWRTPSNAQVFLPLGDNKVDLGSSSSRWKQLYAGTTTIATSDERLKDNIEAIPDEVLDAWGEVNWYQYQFKDSIEEKGETKARIHTGAIAQRIESVFESHNLDANRYGLLCYDEWEAEEEEKDEDGNVITEAREAGNRYSLRYEEALCMEAAYQRRRADRLEERIAKLEALIRTE